jgi:uncharacterized protein (DUF433 family)
MPVDSRGRIVKNPDIFGGKPIVRGMRISVELILSLIAQGESGDDLLADYPGLECEDINACLEYAAGHDGGVGARPKPIRTA